ncbi:unnamed protein product [Parnassius mnemosyne]|uniref:Reverse transcriptase domain-containing protein n=1 Tax=Parnassius mnemosyne TaxID=213953 RepID=A0AAV1K804_9NEOP
MKWTSEVNTFIMRTYYYITKLETDLTTYRTLLHQKFTEQYPGINVSEQRLSDQRRVIVRNKLLSNEILSRLQEEVRNIFIEEEKTHKDSYTAISTLAKCKQLQSYNSSHHPSTQYKNNTHSQSTNLMIEVPDMQLQTQNPLIRGTPMYRNCYLMSDISTQTDTLVTSTMIIENEIETPVVDEIDNDLMKSQLREKLQTAILQYAGIDPTVRPKLPKLKYSRQLLKLIHIFNNNILSQYIHETSKITDIHTIIYCTAFVISQELGYKITNNDNNDRLTKRKQDTTPIWQIRLQRDINKLRSDIGKLTQYIFMNRRSKKIVDRVTAIFKNTSLHTRHESNNSRPEEFLDTLKQKLALKCNRLKRYKKSLQRKQDNNLFINNEKMFYRNLNAGLRNTTADNIDRQHHDTPNKEELESFWSNIWETQVTHNTEAKWILEEKARWEAIEEMKFEEITPEDIRNITYKLHNWKSPGIDKIHNFWYKKLEILHKCIAKNLTEIIYRKQDLPQFITKGITHMLPKGQNSLQPSQYRPITCLPTIYKILTSAITYKIRTHAETHNIIAEEQKGCRRGHMGCKEQLIIDSVIHKHAATKKRNLHCTFIDYQKAFDSIPHSWLIEVLKIYKINNSLIEFLKFIMPRWKTTLYLNSHPNTIITREISIKKGIYQGDSLSPLWFCLALNPLSHILNIQGTGYHLKHGNTDTSITHLIYMDDIKLYTKTYKEMDKLINVTAEFSRDINMKFGLDKCRTLHIIKGKIHTGDYAIDDNENQIITAMEPNDVYKYLGFHQLKSLDHRTIKENLINEYKRRLTNICKTKLSGKHLIKAVNTYAIPVLTYSFGIVKWSKTNIYSIERTTRSILTKHNYHHPKSAIERLTIKRYNGGRGLINIQNLWQKQVHGLQNFFYQKSHTSEIHKAVQCNDLNYTPLNLHQTTLQRPHNLVTNPEQILKEAWKQKVLHGRHYHDLEQPLIDKAASNQWLKIGSLFPETEGFIIAIQDQVINTRNYRKYIIKDPTVLDDKCRKCHIHSETIQHITGACPHLAQTDYTHRHNQVANIIHQTLAIQHNLIQDTITPYYKYIPSTVLENTTHKLYYDRAILTDKTIHYNRPDITLQDKLNKITYLIDIAIPNTHNITKTITEKIHKYTDLQDEISRIWKQEKAYIVPIVLSTTGVIPKHLHHSLKLLNIKENKYIQLQKAAILNTCRIVRKFLQIDENEVAPNIPEHTT